ncbi:C-type lectin domain family 2 member B-like isoform X2 [Corapipo altera]|uniref:C-type lectin domain family 2 member B-like isoform X2 n=1 Tax=Corapipo altera TaxID=415028 RepID=UPI000FD66420|nr:C-type lectin domain family 2 member B-like isoform X2 [Corapipo altera]
MGKGTQRPNSSSQEEPLNTCSDPEKEPKYGSYRTMTGHRTSPKMRVLLALCVLLGILSFSLAVTVTILSVRPRFSELEFSHVCPDTWPGFQGKCYYFSEAEGNWTRGQERCEALGASLATISTREELVRTGMNWFEVRGGGPCGYLNQGRISSSLCHTEKNWICSRPNNFVLWEGKLRDSKSGLSA